MFEFLPPYHNPYFDGDGGKVPPHAARPPFNSPDADCPCSIFGAVTERLQKLQSPASTVFSYLLQHGVLASRRRRLTQAELLYDEGNNSGWRQLQTGTCPPHSSMHPDDQCYCDEGYEVVQGRCQASTDAGAAAFLASLQQIEDAVADPQTGKVIKCTFEYLRMFWEPIPFCLRCE